MCKNKGRAFTLIELLIVVAVIALLLAIAIPCLSKVRQRARRMVCLNNIHQGLVISSMYSSDSDQYLPLGNIIDRKNPQYNETWDESDQLYLFNANTLEVLSVSYGASEKLATCSSAENYLRESKTLLISLPSTHAVTERMLLGWIYWGNRGDWYDSELGKKFITPKKIVDKSTARTLITCFCLSDVGGKEGRWYAPHTTGQFQTGSGKMEHSPEGLAVGYLDGSARFVKWERLTPSDHGGQYVVYYDAAK
jgi:prepilin-type N-terminal cleavage/methylation domain-containing protein